MANVVITGGGTPDQVTADVADGDHFFIAFWVKGSDYVIRPGAVAFRDEYSARKARESAQSAGGSSVRTRTQRVHVHQGSVTARQWCKS